MTWNTVFYTLDIIVFLFFLFSTVYLFVFSFAALGRWKAAYPAAKKLHRFAILFPAYREDTIIKSTILSFLKPEYPKELYDIIVISDRMSEETNERLRLLPITLLTPEFENSSKVKALNFAMEQLQEEKYDIVVVMDADNTVEPDFLQQINNAYYSGSRAIQTHRVAKNLNTDIAILDAISEEMNNSIFRKGHVKLGFSSALIGSGMAFDFQWFLQNIRLISTAGEDKELERLLLKENIYIDYLNHVKVYDEKTAKAGTFYRQRRRWLASQHSILKKGLRDLPHAILHRQTDYCNKIVQWLILPRIILLGCCGLIALGLLFIDWWMAIKWWALLSLLVVTFCFAIPDYLVTNRFIRVLSKIPLLFLMMVANFFRLKGIDREFIHTEHDYVS